MAAAAESLLKSGEVSAMLRQGFIPSSAAAAARFSPKLSSPSSSPTSSAGASAYHPSPPPPCFPSPKPSTLFEMISQEDSSRPPPPPSDRSKRRRIVEKISAILAKEGASWGPADAELSVSSGDGLRVSMAVHRRVLAAWSRFFAEKLAGIATASAASPVAVEICECDDVEAYVEAVGLMYCGDLWRRLAGEEVGRVLGLLKVSVDIKFDAAVFSCLDYLEAIPWSEDEEEKVVSVLTQLRLDERVAGVLQRVSVEPSTSASGDSVFLQVLAGVLQAKDEKARGQMKALVSGLLREDRELSKNYCNRLDVSRETLYYFCHKCLNSLVLCFSEVPKIDEGRRDRGALMGEIAREADNLQWLVEILINKRMADEFVSLWASQIELASLHSKIPCIYRYEISRVTAQLCVAIGRRLILVSKDARISFLETWLEALYEDFGWMKRLCRSFDKKTVEDGLCQTILTLPMAQQEAILLRWFDCFLNKGDDCPNVQRAFEVWWRRAFVRQHVRERNSQLQIVVYDNPT